LVGRKYIGAGLQHPEALRLGDAGERLDGDGTGVLARAHRFPALRRRADRGEFVIAALKSSLRQHLIQHESEAGGERVERQRLALEVLVALDPRRHDEGELHLGRAHEREQVGRARELHRALPFLIGDHVVEGSASDVEFAVDQVLRLIGGIRRRRHVDGDAVVGQTALLLRHEDRQVRRARKADQFDCIHCFCTSFAS
jgi:hypothetical protein